MHEARPHSQSIVDLTTYILMCQWNGDMDELVMDVRRGLLHVRSHHLGIIVKISVPSLS